MRAGRFFPQRATAVAPPLSGPGEKEENVRNAGKTLSGHGRVRAPAGSFSPTAPIARPVRKSSPAPRALRLIAGPTGSPSPPRLGFLPFLRRNLYGKYPLGLREPWRD